MEAMIIDWRNAEKLPIARFIFTDKFDRYKDIQFFDRSGLAIQVLEIESES